MNEKYDNFVETTSSLVPSRLSLLAMLDEVKAKIETMSSPAQSCPSLLAMLNEVKAKIETMSSPAQSCPSLFEMRDKVKKQIDFESFAKPLPNGKMRIDPLIEEICLIIAEVFIRPGGKVMRIRGQEMEVRIVQEVYEKLTHDHIELVADNFKQQTQLIYNKSAYLQTALYNSVFEFHSHYTNLVAHDWH